MRNQVVSREQWLRARLQLLVAEKEFTRQRDALTRRRMAMPWERVEKSYRFEGAMRTASNSRCGGYAGTTNIDAEDAGGALQ